MTARNLKLVEPAPEPPAPNLDYEWKERQRIKARNWAAVHIAADRRPFLALGETKKWRYS
jgi:hypothetical protein